MYVCVCIKYTCICICFCVYMCCSMLSCFSHVQLCDCMDLSPPGSSVRGIFWARILEWVSMPSSRGPSGLRDRTSISCIFCNAGGFFFCLSLWGCPIYIYVYTCTYSPDGASGKEPTCQCRRHERYGFDPWVGKMPWRRKWQPIPVFLPGESHGQKSCGLQSIGSQRVRHDWGDLAQYNLYWESENQRFIFLRNWLTPLWGSQVRNL